MFSGRFGLAPGFDFDVEAEISRRAEMQVRAESYSEFMAGLEAEWITLDQADGRFILSVHGMVGFTNPGPVLRQLRMQPDVPVDVSINSPGGFVGAGVEIYRALVDHAAAVTVSVNGYAASAASLIAAGADDLTVPPGGLVMIHNAWTVLAGNKEDLAQEQRTLEKHDQSIAMIYAAEWGGSLDTWLTLMAEETWFNSEDAAEVLGANKTPMSDTIVDNKDSLDALADARASRASIINERQ